MADSFDPTRPDGSGSDPEACRRNTPEPRDRVNALSGWRRWAVRIGAGLARLWTATLRLRMAPREEGWLRQTDQPMVIILWHNRLFLAGELFRRYRRARTLTALISASRDGAWLTEFFDRVGLRAVRGSSSKRALTATRELLAELRAGYDVGITPDGPRGPCYDFKPGAVLMAVAGHAPILLVSSHFHKGNAWRLNSWDGFWIPKPWARVTIRCRKLDPDQYREPGQREEAARQWRQRLFEITADESTREGEPIALDPARVWPDGRARRPAR